MLSAYIDVPAFQRVAFGVAAASYLGGSTTLTGAVGVGSATLPIGTLAGMQTGQIVYVLDGSASEVTSVTGVSGSAITITPVTTFAHAAGVSVSVPGPQGALAAALLSASTWIENYCQQGTPADRSLWSKSRTEKTRMPTTRAYVDTAYALCLRPRVWPVTSVASITIEWSPTVTFTVDTSQAEYASDGRSVVVPVVQALGTPSPAFWVGPPVGRADQAWVTLVYTAGITSGAVPFDIQQACAFVTQELLAYAQNPTGAAMLRQGDVQIMQRLRGSGNRESSADGIFMAQAKALLQPYKATMN